jgi:hypothetical protein
VEVTLADQAPEAQAQEDHPVEVTLEDQALEVPVPEDQALVMVQVLLM